MKSLFTIPMNRGIWLNQDEDRDRASAEAMPWHPENPRIEGSPREVRAWNRKVNGRRTRINWKFDRSAARKKFGCKWKSITRSKNESWGLPPGWLAVFAGFERGFFANASVPVPGAAEWEPLRPHASAVGKTFEVEKPYCPLLSAPYHLVP